MRNASVLNNVRSKNCAHRKNSSLHLGVVHIYAAYSRKRSAIDFPVLFLPRNESLFIRTRSDPSCAVLTRSLERYKRVYIKYDVRFSFGGRRGGGGWRLCEPFFGVPSTSGRLGPIARGPRTHPIREITCPVKVCPTPETSKNTGHFRSANTSTCVYTYLYTV